MKGSRLLAAATLAASVLATGPALSAETPCIALPPAPPEGLTTKLVQQAWRLEIIKRGTATPLRVATTDCGTKSGVTVQPDAQVRLPNGALVDLASVAAFDRATVLVRAAFDTWATVDDDAPLSDVQLIKTPKLPPAPELRDVWFGGRLSGQWTIQPGPGIHRGWLSMDLHVGLLARRLLVGVRVAFLPPQTFSSASGIGSQLTGFELSALAGWRFDLAPAVGIRLGAGVDLSWSARSVYVPTRKDPVTVTGTEFAVRVEAELEWMWTSAIGLVAALSGQIFPNASGITWLGETVIPAPTFAGGLQLGLRFWFP